MPSKGALHLPDAAHSISIHAGAGHAVCSVAPPVCTLSLIAYSCGMVIPFGSSAVCLLG